MESDWLHEADGRATLTLHIQPGAKKTEVVGLHGDAVKIRLAAPPVDGKANQALIGFIAERLGVSLTILQFEQTGGYQLEQDDEPWDSYDQFVRTAGDR